MLTENGKALLDLTKIRDRTYQKVFETLQSNNSLMGDILKCHLFTEFILEELIKFVLKNNAEAVLSIKLTYQQKLDITSKLKLFDDFLLLDSSIVGSLRKLNSLRNKISHRIALSISSSDIINLFNGLEDSLPYTDMANAAPEVIIRRYMAFIFGNMLPKYEKDQI